MSENCNVYDNMTNVKYIKCYDSNLLFTHPSYLRENCHPVAHIGYRTPRKYMAAMFYLC